MISYLSWLFSGERGAAIAVFTSCIMLGTIIFSAIPAMVVKEGISTNLSIWIPGPVLGLYMFVWLANDIGWEHIRALFQYPGKSQRTTKDL